MKNIKAVIFDMDGILIDTERISFNAFKEVLKGYNYEMSEEFYLTMIGRNVKSIKEVMLSEYGSSFPFDEIYEKKVKIAVETIDRDGVIIKPGVHELVDYLKDNNYRIAVATSTRKERAHYLLEQIGIKDKVDYIICGDQVVNSKPDPEIFLKAAKGIGIEPQNCMVIEDSDAGILAASRAGMTGINVPDMKKPDENMKKLAFKICSSLLDVKTYMESI
ncbi:HAD family phosphatase [uncultured Clostridium sp.]|uniref:HAD family hydrolase n=1 Tax=uncultured Clostridium sp. TaxID=59620 RepID=UPI0025F931C0|nr:HAD family phosphatase [uncultured Clostridium sp.]